jgi:hypothetical protein
VELKGARGYWTAVVTVKRAATGKEETYTLTLTDAKEEPDGPDTLHDGERRSDERGS